MTMLPQGFGFPQIPTIAPPSIPGMDVMGAFDPMDPYGHRRRASQRAPTRYLTPEEEESTLASLQRGLVSGIGAVGRTLDKATGSRALRTVVGKIQGHPDATWRELLSTIPFSDTLRITDPDDIMREEEITGWKDKGNWKHTVGNILVGAALDPTLPLTGFLKGGLTTGGKLLNKAGALQDVDWALRAAGRGGKLTARKATTVGDALDLISDAGLRQRHTANLHRLAANGHNINDIMRQPIGASINFGVPFTTTVNVPVNIPGIDPARDYVMGVLRRSAPGRAVQRALNARAKGMSSEVVQEAAKSAGRMSQGDRQAAYAQFFRQARQLQEAGEWTPEASLPLWRQLEGIDPTTPEYRDIYNSIRGVLDQAQQDRLRFGRPVEFEDRFINQFVHRAGRMGQEPRPRSWQEWQNLSSADKLRFARSEATRQVDGGTAKLMEIGLDPVTQAIRTKQGMLQHLQQNYGAFLPDHIADFNKAANDDTRLGLLEGLADIMLKSSDEVLQQGLYKHPIEGMASYVAKHADWKATANAQIDAIGSTMKPVPEGVTLNELFGSRYSPTHNRRIYDVDMRPIVLDRLRVAKASESPLDGGAYVELINRYGDDATKQQLRQLDTDWRRAAAGGNPDDLENAASAIENFMETFGNTMRVGQDVADDIRRWDNVFKVDGATGDILKFVDSLTNMFKAGVLTWPARYVRDLTSGQIQSALMGWWSPKMARNAARFVKSGQVADPKELLRSMDPTVVQAMSEAEAQEAVKALVGSVDLIGAHQAAQAQVGTIGRGDIVEEYLQNLPGNRPLTLGKGTVDELRELWRNPRQAANPLNIRGVGFTGPVRETTTNAMVRAGDNVGLWTDSINRLEPFFYLLREGYDPQQAAQMVKAAQVDYSSGALTAIEKKYMARLFPFYRFSRGIIPFVAEEILNRPAGMLAQVVRGSGKMAEAEGSFVPEHVRQTLAAKVPDFLQPKDKKHTRYLTGLGLMHEDALGLLRPGQTFSDTVMGTTQEVLGRLNPLAKVPIELGTGTQLFTGRPLRDLESPVNRLLANMNIIEEPRSMPSSPVVDELLSNSMFARGLSTLRTLSDERKGVGAKLLNVLTGMRVTDIDERKARNIAIREAIDDRLRGTPGVRSLRPHLYVRQEDWNLLDPTEQLLMSLYQQQRLQYPTLS